MALTFLCGFESGSVQGEFRDVYGSPTVQSSVVRSGSYALQVNKSGGSSHYLQVFKRAAGGTAIAAFNSFRFYIQIGSLPTTLCQITNGSASISIDTTGAIKYLSVISTNTLSVDGLWHLIEVYGSTSTGFVYVDVDGVNWLISAGSMTAAASFSIGAISSSSAINIYFDDIAIFDTESLGWRGDSKQVLLLPTADPGALNSWTDGGGGTTSIFEGVNNRPPTGVAAATNGTKIKNAASGSNLDYTPTMQTYTAAGVPSGSTVNAVISLCNHGEEVATGTKAGDVWIASNPAQSAGSGTFDYGDDTATVVGTFPTGWRTAYGAGSIAPSVTLGTAPTMTVRKTGSTNRVVDVDFMAIYVDYTPPPAPSVADTITTAESVTLSIDTGNTRVVSATDTVSVTESTTRQINTERSVSDAASVVESFTPTVVSFVSTSDSATGSENLSTVSASNVTVSDAATATESASATLNTSASVLDSAAVTESATPSVQTAISATETATVAENATATVNTSFSISDASTATESAPSSVQTALNVNDATTGTEDAALSIQTAAAGTLTVFDASTAAESATLSVQTTATATDTATATESVSNAVRVQPSVTDSATATESASARLNTSASVVDTATAAESVQNAVNVRPSVTDAATVAESRTTQVNTTPSVFDAATVTENNTATVNTTATVSDAASVTESATPDIQTRISATDAATVTESAQAVLLTFAVVSDTIAATEYSAFDVRAYIAVTDAATVAELVDILATSGLAIRVSDSAVVAEAASAGLLSYISVSDVAAVVERITAGKPDGTGWRGAIAPAYVISATLTGVTVSAAITAAAAPAATLSAVTAPAATITAAEIVAEIEGI